MAPVNSCSPLKPVIRGVPLWESISARSWLATMRLSLPLATTTPCVSTPYFWPSDWASMAFFARSITRTWTRGEAAP